jgi:hypothetical protein
MRKLVFAIAYVTPNQMAMHKNMNTFFLMIFATSYKVSVLSKVARW